MYELHGDFDQGYLWRGLLPDQHFVVLRHVGRGELMLPGPGIFNSVVPY